MARPSFLLAAVLAALLPAAVMAAESSTEARLRDALRAANTQLQAAEDERAKVQAANAEQKKQLEDLKAKLAAATAAARPAVRTNDRELQEVNRKLAEAKERGDRLDQAAAQCQAALQDASQAARAKEDERAQLADRFGPLNDRVSVCESRNAKMFQVATEILHRYEKSGGREPFLGLKRVELENLAQDYRDDLADQRIPKQP